MSGRQIGSAVGFVVGLYFGNPQAGMMIGGMIGGAVDPDQIQGNKIGDVPAQRSQPGGPQAVVLGTSLVSNCTIMSQGPDMIVKEKTDPGKGSGTEVVNEVLYRHFSVRVCRSSPAEDNQVQGIVAVYMAGNLVYDVRPESKLSAADNAKWKKDWTFYYGGPDQGVDPTEQSYLGVGEVSAHRQICRMVGKKINLTDYGNLIPPFEVVVSQCPVEPPNYLLVTGSAIDEGGPLLAAAQAKSPLTFTGIEQSSGGTISGGAPTYYGGKWVVHSQSGNVGQFSTDNRQAWTPFTTDRASTGYLAAGPDGLLVNGLGSASAYDKLGLAPSIGDAVAPLQFATEYPPGTPLRPFGQGNEAYMCCYSGGYWWIDTGSQGELVRATSIFATTHQVVYKRSWFEHVFLQVEVHDGTAYAVTAAGKLISSPDLGETWSVVLDTAPFGEHSPVYLKSGNGKLLALSQDSSQVWTSEDGFAAPHATGIAGDTTGNPPNYCRYGRGEMMAYTGENFYIISSTNVLAPAMGDMGVMTADGIVFETPAPLPVIGATGIAASVDFAPAGGGMVVPDAPGHYYDPITGEVLGPTQGVAQLCGTTLGNVHRWLCHRGQLTDDEIDVSELEDIPVRGITFQTTGSCKSEMEPLRLAHFYDTSDFDGKHRTRLRGAEDVDMVIDSGLCVVTDDEEEENTLIGQDVEYPKRHHLEYLCLDLDYIRTTATAERTSIDPTVVGETQASINEVFTKEEGDYIAAIQMKQQWMTREGGRKFGTGLEFIELVGASLIEMDGRRGRIDSYSIDLNEIWFDSVPYDRASAVRARVITAPAVPPTAPPSQVRGPSISAVMNAPVLRDADDKAGTYWGICGPLRGWKGAQLQLSRDGGATWEDGPQVTTGCVMGALSAALPAASRYVQDNTNVLSLTLFREDMGIDSTDFAGLMAERNVWAIQYPDGTVEIGQSETAIETAPRQWELRGHMRGRQDTLAGEHLVGATFVLLNDAVRFVAIRPDDVGKTLTFRAVSLGTDPDAAEEQTITFSTIESLREWQPYNVVVTPDGLGGYCVAWIGRARLGSSRTPVHSQWFEGYRVTFTIGSVTHIVDTNAQSVCVSAETMLEVFGPSHGIPTITVRARSRVATNDDDFDSPPGNPSGDPFPSYPATVIGEPGDMYEGEGVLENIGPLFGEAFQAYGGKTDEYFTGYIARNVTCQNTFKPGSGFMVGVPLTAGTAAADTTMYASGPDIVGDPLTITDSVTVQAMPAFAVMDELNGWGEKPLATLVTSTPRTTKRVTSSGLGGLRSRVGFNSGKRRAVFTIDNMPADGRIAVGVLAGGVNAHLAPGTGTSFAYITDHNGAFAVETDAATGNTTITEIGVGLVASGTLPLTYAHDGKYRFAWVANDATHPATGATVHVNQGNEAWPDTPSSGFGGVPNEPHVIPCGWDAEVAAANGYRPQGTQSLTLATAGGFSGTSVVYAYSEFAKSTGQWRIGMAAATNGHARIGLCKAGHTGALGQGGDSFGMSYDFAVIGSPQLVFDTTWAGQIRIPHPFYVMDRKIVFVCDFDAHTVEVWGKPQFSDYILLTVLTGLPSGSWVPAGNHAVELINGASEIPGATDWSVTKTP